MFFFTYLGLPSRVELYKRRASADCRLRIYQRPAFDYLSVLRYRNEVTYEDEPAPIALEDVNTTDDT